MKKIFLIILLGSFSMIGLAQAKGSEEWHANWEFGFPTGNNFVTNFSALGFDMGYSRFIKDNLSVGLQMGWNNYYQYEARKTYEFAGGAATTDLYKYVYTLPITAYVSYFFHGSKAVTPFGRLHIGAQYSEQNIYYNIYETTNDNWGFVVMPEIGAVIHFAPGNPWGLNLSARYAYSTNSAPDFNISSVQTLNFSVGIAYLIK